jgi:hypothetical protein
VEDKVEIILLHHLLDIPVDLVVEELEMPILNHLQDLVMKVEV